MADDFIQVAADGVGAKVRTRARTIGANAIEEQYVILQREAVRACGYAVHTGAHLILATADAATVGRWWLINPVGSAVLIALRKVSFQSQLGSALATVTSPRITLERFTFTGTASGATVTVALRRTGDAAPVGSVRTASTGLTLTAGGAVQAFLPVACGTAVGFTNPSSDEYAPYDDDVIVLGAGEGIVCRQPDAGTTADTRRFVTNLYVEEFTLP